MTEPLALLPLAVAAHGGRVDDLQAQQLVAAGLTLLRRCAPLVRSLMGRRAAILLPNGPAFLTALAAAEGHSAVLLEPDTEPPALARQLAGANVGAVFTTAALGKALPTAVPRVLLDAAPAHATFLEPTGSRVVDLGSHVGLEIAGEEDAPGRDEEAVIAATGTETGAPLTHRELLADARATIAAVDLTAADHALAVLPFSHRLGLTASLVAPLLAGARVTTMARFEAHRALDIARADQITMLCGVPDTYAALLAAIEHGGGGRRPTALRICLCGGPPASPTLEDRWRSATGVVLTRAPAG